MSETAGEGTGVPGEGVGEGQGQEDIRSEFHAVRRAAEASSREARQAQERLQQAARVLQGEDPRGQQKQVPGGWFDGLAAQFIEQRAAGAQYPATELLATELYKAQQEQAAMAEKLQMALSKIEQMSNPQQRAEEQSFIRLDDMVSASVERVYGEANPAVQQAIESEIIETIKYIKANDPRMWQDIRRDERALGKLVNWATQQVIPPAIRQRLHAEAEAAVPLTMGDFVSAYKEIGNVPPALRGRVQAALRQQEYVWKHEQRQKVMRRARGYR